MCYSQKGIDMAKKSNNPKLVIEAVLSAFRWFLVFVVLNNAVWIALFCGTKQPSGTQIKMIQDGTGNTSYTQSVTTPESK